jgi:hypothetical protein
MKNFSCLEGKRALELCKIVNEEKQVSRGVPAITVYFFCKVSGFPKQIF